MRWEHKIGPPWLLCILWKCGVNTFCSSECTLTPSLAPDDVYGSIGEDAVVTVVYMLTRLRKTEMCVSGRL